MVVASSSSTAAHKNYMIHHYHLVQDSCFMQDTEGVEEEVRGVCNAVLFVYAHNKNEIKGSSSGATGKLAAHTHFIEHILSVLDFLNVLYCDQTNKMKAVTCGICRHNYGRTGLAWIINGLH
uniref:Uncharacterized protein n=1 Tax=Oryza glumipatula TaxID=40148 RepID=A0A0D9YRN4_9ORYZ